MQKNISSQVQLAENICGSKVDEQQESQVRDLGKCQTIAVEHQHS